MKFFFSAILLVTSYWLLVTSVSAHSSVTVVKMTPNAFEPDNVSVDENSTIIFLNQDTVPRWPASNIHPTHELYPEFDPKKAINPGESWSFKPKKPGVWKFHDHLNPHLRGTLTVIPEEGQTKGVSSPNILETVKNHLSSLLNKISSLLPFTRSGQQTLNAQEFKKLTSEEQFRSLTDFAKAQGAEKAWSFITETFKTEAGSTGNIHDLAHLAGKLLYNDKGISGIGICTPIFAFGCYHGLLDTAFQKSLTDLPQAEKECEKVGAVNSGPYGSCIHGIGHGVASFHISRDIENTLLDCNLLKQGRDFCFDGVFMEFVRSAQTSFYTKDKPFYPCDALEEDYGDIYSLSCGRNQPVVFVSRLGLAFEDAIKLCGNNTLSDKFKGSCFDALGFMLASTQDVNKIVNGCKSMTGTRYSSLCFKSAAGELIFQNVPNWQEKSKAVCDASPTRQQCHENRERLIRDYGRDEESYVRSQMRTCFESGGSDGCYEKVANALSERFGLKKTLEIFAKNEQYPEIYSRCHEATHYLSRNEYKKTDSIPAVYAQCDSTCHGGCYHGALEAYLKEKEEALEDIPKAFVNICGKAEDYDKPLVFNECHHGLGHAAMFVYDMEVPESLSLCDNLAAQDINKFDAIAIKERCYSGVFMENSSSSTNNDHPGRWVKEDDPLFPCNSLDQKYAKICYRYQSSHFAMITHHDWAKTASLCLTVPQDYQDDCFRTIGTNQVGFTQDISLMRQNCSLMPNSHFQEVCLVGVISSFAYRFVGDDTRMASFCSSVSTNYQEGCFKQMGTSVSEWSSDKNQAVVLCEQVQNTQFSSWCKNGIN